MDGVHPQHNTIASYGWIKRGQTKRLKTKELFYVEDKRINNQSMIALLNKIRNKQKEGKIHIISDNARYYHLEIVKKFLKEHPRIHLKFMPPYSSNLKVIERLWKILKKKVVYDKFYMKFDDFREKVIDFLDNRIWLNNEFKNILTDNFQIIKPNFSGSYL